MTVAAAPNRVHKIEASGLGSADNTLDNKVREQMQINLPLDAGLIAMPALAGDARAIEDESFPFEKLSDIAEAESWRKEINRPIYHIHKWWAQRLGSAFRAIIIGTLAPQGANVQDLFYTATRFPGKIIFDPFMGSGTTVGEALKLGCSAIGRDINPVAHFLVRNAMGTHDRGAIEQTFRSIGSEVAPQLEPYYRTTLASGEEATVLYYFWVKQLDCPKCCRPVDLFSSRIFAKHAYASRHPAAHASCPNCLSVNRTRYDARSVTCGTCMTEYDPSVGPARGRNAVCPACNHTFPIGQTAREADNPPEERMYAKLVLRKDGTKTYEAINRADIDLYSLAVVELQKRLSPYPVVPIEPGYNTNQALGYGYRYWHQMFNDRQLLGLSLLAERIRRINDPRVRDLFTCLFSGTLEFNNTFASYKGEGTGAVRHMFAHHILKPERTPLEANLWGTPKSSGSFSTMFHGRIRRALDYAERPFELKLGDQNAKRANSKVYDLSEPLSHQVAESYDEFRDKRLYLSCGDSSATDLPDGSVDAIITDPPFFDNVHYSQLADFFHVWQQHLLGGGEHEVARSLTTRSDREVQNEHADAFADRLTDVWREACRVLHDDGLLVFSYHHSRPQGWSSVLAALINAGFTVTATQPIKAEMSVATPKQQAKEPIDLDLIIVCRKRSGRATRLVDVERNAVRQVQRFQHAGRRLSRNDVRVIVMGHVLQRHSMMDTASEATAAMEGSEGTLEGVIDRVWSSTTKTLEAV